MKEISYFVASLVIVASGASFTSCGGSDADKENKTEKTTVVKEGEKATASDTTSTPVAGQVTVRYIDEEKLFEDYSLAKDFQESITRLQSKLVSAQESRAKEIQQLGQQIENKMKSNGYTSESEYNADMARFNKKQQDAQTYLASLQRSTEIEVNQLQTQLQDSITTFVKSYSVEKGYDAVLLKSASLYFNPAFDVTADVVKGLNARYNKVQEK